MLKRHLLPRRCAQVAAAVAALTLAAGCGSADTGSTGDAEPSPSSSTPPSSETETSADAAAEATPIDGTWTTPTLAPADFRRALTEQGVGRHADAFLSDFGESVALTLEVGGGFWTLSSSIDGGATAVTDRGSFEVGGKQVTVLPNSGGENTFRWKVVGDELMLDLVATTEPPYEGVPAEVYQRGLYTTSPFTADAS